MQSEHASTALFIKLILVNLYLEKLKTFHIHNVTSTVTKTLMQETKIETPMWELDDIQDSGLNILPLICELPSDPLFSKLEFTGQFNDAIINQLVNLIRQLQGHMPSGGLMKMDFKATLKDDYDMILIMLQKDYSCSTRTLALALNDKGNEDISKYDNEYTAKFYKNGTISQKHDVSLDLRDGVIRFAYFGKKNITDDDTTRLKKKIA